MLENIKSSNKKAEKLDSTSKLQSDKEKEALKKKLFVNELILVVFAGKIDSMVSKVQKDDSGVKALMENLINDN
jgi:hypothetical protein